jgi:hypothetical protein
MNPVILNFAEMSSMQAFILQILALALCVPMVIAVVAIVAGAWTKVNKLRLENALKQQMVDRGMSADEIVAVVASTRRSGYAAESPCASEVVVDYDGEWQTGLILKHEGERYFVHIVGTDMSENRWVTRDQIRIPAGSEGQCGAPWDWTFPAGAFATGNWCGNARHAKPEPVDQEI